MTYNNKNANKSSTSKNELASYIAKMSYDFPDNPIVVTM